MTDKNLLLQDDAFAPPVADTLECLPSFHCSKPEIDPRFAAAHYGRDLKQDHAPAQPIEPQIDGYPLWSGLPPPKQATLPEMPMCAKSQTAAAQADDPKRNRFPLSDEDKAAFHKAAENRDQAVELPSGALMFINYGDGPQDYSDLDCPHCGGSGHKGDIADTPPIPQPLIAEAARDDVAGDAK